MMPTDALLFDRWMQSRDAEAFREMVNRHAALVYATARRILGDPAAAEDVAQDCFLKLVEAPRPARNLPAWLHRVAARRALEVLRSERRRRAAEARAPRPDREAGLEPTWDEVEPLVDEAVEGLPDELRIPVVLHFLEGRTHEAIADQVGSAKATVAYRIARGIEAIRSFLKRRGIAVTSALIAGWLSERLAEAAPPALIASLGKLALAGPAAARAGSPEGDSDPSPAPVLPAAGARISLKAVLSAAAGVALLGAAVAIALWQGETGSGREVAEPSAKPAAGPAVARKEAEPGPPEKKEIPPATPVAEAPKPDLLAIAGRVVDPDGNPIPGAEVFLAVHPPDWFPQGWERRLDPDWWSLSHWRSTVAGAGGEFRFEGIQPPGEISLAAFHEGREGGMRRLRLEAGKPPEDVEVKLPEGKTLRGTVVGQDDRPVTDAIVSVYQAWHPKEMIYRGGMGATDAGGRFRIGMPTKAELCTLRVSSDSRGQDFFVGLAVTGEEILLKMKEPGTVGGRITWADGSPAKGVVVILRGEVPEPKVPNWRSGERSQLHLEGVPDGEGRYEIAGVPPGLEFEPLVIADGKDRLKALLQRLTPRGPNRLRFETGEAKTWDVTLAKPIFVRGTIRTERAGIPVPRIRLGVRKDGMAIGGYFPETDDDGAFQAVLNTGPGRYVFHAVPFPNGAAGDLIAERFGQVLDLKDGEEVEVDLRIFEPVVLPVRVVDADGKPVKDIRTEIRFVLTGGQRQGMGVPKELDADGRGSFVFHFPIEELALQVSAFPQGPFTEARTFRLSPGAALPEETFVLERTRALTAALLGADGSPASEANVTIDAAYADGKTDRFSARTDRKGRFSVEGRLRAAAVVLKIKSDGAEGSWKSGAIDPGGQPLDLGEVKIAPDQPATGAGDGTEPASPPGPAVEGDL
jgi:RNA polymerase sigma factor (sigma-70 family)